MKWKKQADLARQMSSGELLFHLYITQVILLVISFFAGMFLFDDVLNPKTLFSFNLKWVLLGTVNGLAVVFIDILLMNMLPETYYDDGGINTKLFSGMPYWKILLVALLVAFSEELLFRGIIQTTFGLMAASIIFALVHLRYWAHWYLAINVIILSFWLGMVYEWSGQQLLPVMAMHFTIDFLLGLYIRKKCDYEK